MNSKYLDSMLDKNYCETDLGFLIFSIDHFSFIPDKEIKKMLVHVKSPGNFSELILDLIEDYVDYRLIKYNVKQ